MTWTNLLANKEAQKHKTSKKELDNMRALIARDLADAGLAGLSADRRFATAYNAALQAANMAIACAGYRIMSKVGHHRVSLESTKLVLGKPMHKYADYFETCRRKRNTIDYTFSNVATETEAKEILEEIGDSQNYHLVPNLSDEGRLGVVLSCSRKNGRF